MKRPLSAEQRERADAAYERGWADSLRAHSRHSGQPMEDIYWYGKGWEACAEYRWQDPANRGVAPDPHFRIPRQ